MPKGIGCGKIDGGKNSVRCRNRIIAPLPPHLSSFGRSEGFRLFLEFPSTLCNHLSYENVIWNLGLEVGTQPTTNNWQFDRFMYQDGVMNSWHMAPGAAPPTRRGRRQKTRSTLAYLGLMRARAPKTRPGDYSFGGQGPGSYLVISSRSLHGSAA